MTAKKEETVGGISLKIEVPLADQDKLGSTYEDIVDAIRRGVNEVVLIHNLGEINFAHEELKKFKVWVEKETD